MAKIVHAADLHLNSPLQGLDQHYPHEDWHVPTRQTLTALVATTIDESADALVLAGDIVDRGWYADDAVWLLARSLRTLDEAGVTVLMVDGNHEAACQARERLTDVSGRLPPRVHWVSDEESRTVVLDEAGLALHGRGVPTSAAVNDLVPGFPPPQPGLVNVGVLHTSLDRSLPVKRCAPTTPDALIQTGYDYWALGHMHRREVMGTEPWIVIAGTAQGRNATENGPKGATVIDTDAGQITTVRLHELASIRWERARLDSTASHTVADLADLALARLRTTAAGLRSGQRLAARIELTGAAMCAEDQVKVARQIRAAASSDPRYLIERINVIG